MPTHTLPVAGRKSSLCTKVLGARRRAPGGEGRTAGRGRENRRGAGGALAGLRWPKPQLSLQLGSSVDRMSTFLAEITPSYGWGNQGGPSTCGFSETFYSVRPKVQGNLTFWPSPSLSARKLDFLARCSPRTPVSRPFSAALSRFCSICYRTSRTCSTDCATLLPRPSEHSGFGRPAPHRDVPGAPSAQLVSTAQRK